jgi:hypothetical protein
MHLMREAASSRGADVSQSTPASGGKHHLMLLRRPVRMLHESQGGRVSDVRLNREIETNKGRNRCSLT